MNATLLRYSSVFARPTIKVKLTLLVLFSLVMLVLVGGSGWVGVTRVGGALGNVTDRTLPAVSDLTGMRVAQLDTVLLTREVLAWNMVLDQYRDVADKTDAIKDTREFLADVLTRKKAARQQAAQFYAEYAKLPKTRDEAATWQLLQQQWAAFFDGEDTVLNTLEDARKTDDWELLSGRIKALADLEGSAQKIVQDTEKSLNGLIALNRGYARTAQHTGNVARAGSVRLIAVIFVLATGGLLAIAGMILRSVVGSLEAMRRAIVSVAESNDFTTRIAVKGRDEAAQTAEAFNGQTMQRSLREVLENAGLIADAANQSSEASAQVLAASTGQSEAATAIATAIEEMTASIHHIAGSTRDAQDQARDSGNAADEGAHIISDTTGEMDGIASQVGEAAETINEVGAEAEKITMVVELINDVADQTGLLALNAAIEAARAGEQGRGFAVVADEVRKLADRTMKATREITEMVEGMQRSSRDAVSRMNAVVVRVQNGKELTGRAAGRMGTIQANAKQVTEAITAVAAALEEQSVTTRDIAGRVDLVARMSEDNCEAAAQTAKVSQELTGMADTLREAAGRFRV